MADQLALDRNMVPDSRAEFEAWADSRKPRSLRSSVTDDYNYPLGNLAFEVWQAATQRQQERIAELEAQVQALSLDAGRLDWLATQEGSYRGIDGDLPDLPFWEVCGVEGQNVREAIDAAIAAGKGEA